MATDYRGFISTQKEENVTDLQYPERMFSGGGVTRWW
jgi:hypothetical protein